MVFAAVILFGGGLTVRLALDARANRAIGEEIARLEAEAGRLERRNGELRALIDHFSSASFAESEARTKLGLRAEGERVVVLERDAKPTVVGKPNRGGPSNPVRWFQYFFKNEK